jgi:hypothetical protein
MWADPEQGKKYLREYGPKWRAANKEKCRKYSRDYYRRNADLQKKRHYLYMLKRRFGTAAAETYEEMLAAQENACLICLTPFDKKRPAVDHNHATNRLRGLLCSNCNTALGLLKDSRKMLMNAISYLEVFDAA